MSTSSLIALSTSTVSSLGTFIFGLLPNVWVAVIGIIAFFAVVGWITFRHH